MPTVDGFARVRGHLQHGARWDAAFDWLLPLRARTKGPRYWSPLSVAARAALRFAELDARRVLDVGAGPGKFCIAAALARPDLLLCGVEQRHSLVKTAQELAAGLQLTNVEFRVGDALAVPWRDFDGFFFFNPFAENVFASEDVFDTGVELSESRLGTELLTTFRLLASLRCGSVVITYCGLGGPIPSSYDLVHDEPLGSAALRTWVKRRAYEDDWLHLDEQDDVTVLSRPGVERDLERMAMGIVPPP